MQAVPGQRAIVDDVVYQYDGQQWRLDLSPGAAQAYNQANPLPPTPYERFGRGAYDVAVSVPQMFGQTDDEQLARDTALYERGADAATGGGIDWWRMGGQAAQQAPLALIPGGGQSALARTALGALGGAAGGALTYADEGERWTNVGAGAGAGGLLGYALQPVLQFVARKAVGPIRQTLGRGQLITDASNALAEAGIQLDEAGARAIREAAEDAARQGVDLSPDEIVRVARAKRFGAPITRGQISRDPLQFSDEVNLAKLEGGERVREIFERQDEAITGYLDETLEGFGGAREFSDAGGEVAQAARSQSEVMQRAVTDAYKVAERVAPDARIPGAAVKGMAAPVRSRFRNALEGGAGDVLRRIDELAKKGATPKDLDDLYKLINQHGGTPDRALNTALGDLKQGVRELISDMGEEYAESYGAAVSKAAQRFDEIGEGTLSRIVDDTLPNQDTIVPQLMTGNTDEAERIMGFIGRQSPDAVNAVRGAALDRIIEASTPSGNFSQAAFWKQIQRIGPRRLRNLFGDELAGELMELRQLARDLMAAPKGNRINRSNSGIYIQQMIGNWFRKVLPAAVPGIGENVARMMETGANRAAARAAQQLGRGPMTRALAAPIASPAAQAADQYMTRRR